MMSPYCNDDDGTPDVYRRLGLRRCINASGHVTFPLPSRIFRADAVLPVTEEVVQRGCRSNRSTSATVLLTNVRKEPSLTWTP